MKVKLQKWILSFSILLVFVMLALPGCNLIPVPVQSTDGSPTPITTNTPISPSWSLPSVQTGTTLEPGLSEIVTRVRPSVVAINVTILNFNIFNQPVTTEGAGSGWVIDANGIIVTNNHVVADAEQINVTLDDGRIFPAIQVARDQATDLAVIKIAATGLTPLAIGDSSKMKVGMQVVVIGNALGEGISITGGWLSRTDASITIGGGLNTPAETLYGLLGTDAAINPGNSGGPLVNTASEIIGITNAKLVASGVENVGYAISINSAMPIIQQLVTKGSVTRAYFGVALATVNEGIARQFGLAVNSGVLVTNVVSNSPAAAAGLQQGDVIVNINSVDVISASQAAQTIWASPIGQRVPVTYWRGNDKRTTEVIPIQSSSS